MAPLPADYKQTEEKSFKGTESGRNVLESNAKYTTTADQGSNPASKPTRINTCLLYTSPSPRDQRGSRMPSSA